MTIEEHYKAIAPKLTNWLVASGSSYHEACDIVQSVFLKIWKMRDDLHENDEEVSGLAFTIARNLRKNMARNDAHIAFVEEIKDEDAGSVNPASLPSDAAYLRKRLSEAFAKLPPVLREVYTLFQVGEMSISDTARQTGLTENLMRVRIVRAKQKIRKLRADLHVEG